MCKACGSLSNANLHDATTLNNYFAHDRPLICGDCVKKGCSARNSKFYKCSACFENYDAICRSRENPPLERSKIANLAQDKSWYATRAPKKKRTRKNARDENSKQASAKNANAAPKRNTMTIVPCMLLRSKKTMDHGKPTCCCKCSWKKILVAPGASRTWQAN